MKHNVEAIGRAMPDWDNGGARARALFARGDRAIRGHAGGKSAFCYRIWCLLLSNTIVSMCIVSVFCMYFCPYLAIFLRIRRIHRIHVSDAYPTCIRCIHLYPPSRPKYARICPRIRTVDSHSVGRKRGFVSIFVFFAEYIVNTRCIHTYLDVFRRNIREYR